MKESLRGQIETLAERRRLSLADYKTLIRERTPDAAELLAALAVKERKRVYGDAVYTRGLLEISNICKNDCLYCGIRRSNTHCERYRLTPE
ncbi:MAG: [Oscillibacter sp.]|nr:[FeFe] hydrogenase H-cluster radical SAM maturase HydE [Oscillibacter sp.]